MNTISSMLGYGSTNNTERYVAPTAAELRTKYAHLLNNKHLLAFANWYRYGGVLNQDIAQFADKRLASMDLSLIKDEKAKRLIAAYEELKSQGRHLKSRHFLSKISLIAENLLKAK